MALHRFAPSNHAGKARRTTHSADVYSDSAYRSAEAESESESPRLARRKIGLIKLIFNIRRLVTLEKWPPPGRRTSTKPEKIVAKLRQVDVLTAQGKYVADAIWSICVTEVVPL